MFVDCKLRRHDVLPAPSVGPQKLDLPTDEIYKMLGYLEHIGSESSKAALVYYTPGGNRAALAEGKSVDRVEGEMLLVAVDPATDSDQRTAFEAIVEKIGNLLDERE